MPPTGSHRKAKTGLPARVARWLGRTQLLSLVLTVLGIVALVYGIIVAVQAKAATPLLGTGVALVFLAFAFRGDSGEVRVGWGDASISVIRGVRDALEATADAADAEELREQIQELAGGLGAVESRLVSKGSHESLSSTQDHLLRFLTARLRESYVSVLPEAPWGDASTAHGLRGDQMVITIVYGDLDATALYCAVTDPAGVDHVTQVERTLLILGTSVYSTSYPRDFPNANQLQPGAYSVSWQKVRPGGEPGEEIGVDTFEIPPRG